MTETQLYVYTFVYVHVYKHTRVHMCAHPDTHSWPLHNAGSPDPV